MSAASGPEDLADRGRRNPVFRPDEPYASIASLNPEQAGAYEQFGAVFAGDGSFMRYREDYDPKLHAKKKPPRPRRSRPDVRKLQGGDPAGEEAARMADEAHEAFTQDVSDQLNADA